MKILSLAASAATIAMLGACSGAPVGLDSSAPSLELATTSTTTATTTTTDSTTSTCTTSTTSDTSDSVETLDTSTTTSTGIQLSASGTYAVAYGGALFIVECTDSP